MIVGIIGKKGSGKDTSAEILVNRLGFTRRAFADPIKEGCKHLFGFTDEQLYGNDKEKIDDHWNLTPRQAFQILGTEVFQYFLPSRLEALQKINRYFWVHRFILWRKNNPGIDRIVIPDVRFLHEANSLRKLGENEPVYILKVVRNSLKNTDSHLSETEIDEITNIDTIVQNNSTIKRMNDIVLKKVSNWIKNVSDKDIERN